MQKRCTENHSFSGDALDLQGFKEPLNVWVWTLHVANVRPGGFQFVLKKAAGLPPCRLTGDKARSPHTAAVGRLWPPQSHYSPESIRIRQPYWQLRCLVRGVASQRISRRGVLSLTSLARFTGGFEVASFRRLKSLMTRAT